MIHIPPKEGGIEHLQNWQFFSNIYQEIKQKQLKLACAMLYVADALLSIR